MKVNNVSHRPGYLFAPLLEMKSAQRGGDFIGNSCDNKVGHLNPNYIREYFYLGFRGYGFDFIPHDILFLFVFTICLRVMDTNDTSIILVG